MAWLRCGYGAAFIHTLPRFHSKIAAPDRIENAGVGGSSPPLAIKISPANAGLYILANIQISSRIWLHDSLIPINKE